MKRNDWIVILAVMFFISVASSFAIIYILDKYFIPKVKTVSMMSVINDENDDEYQKFLDGKLSQEEYLKKVEERMLKIQNALDYFSNGKDILLIEEAVVKTNKNNFISITQAVKNYVN
ncbi:MAG: hypothetical protein PHE16_09795 [Aliarcobacter sp.]|nr:hypothetical protein [Aliarcobacter sp.]